MRSFLFSFLFLLSAQAAQSQVITTIAGTGVRGESASGTPATAAMLYEPVSVTVDKNSNIYVVEQVPNLIHKIDTNGIMTTIAGTGIFGYSVDGTPATDCTLASPLQVAIDKHGRIFFAELGSYSIRYIDDSGLLQTIVGQADTGFNGDGLAASLTKVRWITSLCFDTLGQLYFHDNNRIRLIDTIGIVHTVAGNGVSGFGLESQMATSSKLLAGPLAVNKLTNEVYFSEVSRIRKITSSGLLQTVIGDTVNGCNETYMPALNAKLDHVFYFTIDDTGQVYFGSNNKVCELKSDGNVRVLAGICSAGYNGDHILASTALIADPFCVTVDYKGVIFVVERVAYRVRCIGCSNQLSVPPSEKLPRAIMNVFPNPSYGSDINISIQGIVDENVQYKLYDAQLRCIGEWSSESNKTLRIPPLLLDGIYMLEAHVKESTLRTRLIVN